MYECYSVKSGRHYRHGATLLLARTLPLRVNKIVKQHQLVTPFVMQPEVIARQVTSESRAHPVAPAENTHQSHCVLLSLPF
jgi:hypothetical protein